MTTGRLLLLAAACALVAGPACAGILDSPPPIGVAVYRISPVYYEPGRVDTVVSCHNLTGGAVSTALEVFGDDDRPRGGVARSTVPADGDVLFVTSADAGLEHATVVPDLSPLPGGRARVSATSPELTCSATQRIRSAEGALKETAVELVKRIAPAGH